MFVYGAGVTFSTVFLQIALCYTLLASVKGNSLFFCTIQEDFGQVYENVNVNHVCSTYSGMGYQLMTAAYVSESRILACILTCPQ